MLGRLLIWGRHITHQILRSGNVRNTDISLNISKFPALIRNRETTDGAKTVIDMKTYDIINVKLSTESVVLFHDFFGL